MALPTIDYSFVSAATNASTIQAVMTKLHAMLVVKGWTIEYADSDAIGGGTGSTPAWDKTPAVNTDAGVVVYRMPANDHATEWYVKIIPMWGSAAVDRLAIRFLQAGTGHSGGTLTGGGSGITLAASTATNISNAAHHVAVSEDGFAVLWDGVGNTPFALVERVRAADGTVTDAVLAMFRINGTGANFRRASYTAAAGEDLVSDTIFLGRVSDSGIMSGLNVVVSLASADGSASPIVGPYLARESMLAAPPRLLNFIAPLDNSLGNTIQQYVDGGAKVYQTGLTSHTIGHVAIATE